MLPPVNIPESSSGTSSCPDKFEDLDPPSRRHLLVSSSSDLVDLPLV